MWWKVSELAIHQVFTQQVGFRQEFNLKQAESKEDETFYLYGDERTMRQGILNGSDCAWNDGT